MKIPCYAAAAAVAVAVLVFTPAASAHVTLQPEEVTTGDFTRLDVRVPTERDDASTTKVEVRFPPGFLSVSTEPEPGWNAEIAMRKLDKPVEQFGERVTEEVDRLILTANGEANAIGPGQFRDFGLSVAVPDKPGATLKFPAVQTYSSGEVVRWIGPEDAESPAPQVKLTAAEAEAGGSQAAQQQAPAGDDDDDGGSDTLSIIALIVGIAGLATGLAALFTRRRAPVGTA